MSLCNSELDGGLWGGLGECSECMGRRGWSALCKGLKGSPKSVISL